MIVLSLNVRGIGSSIKQQAMRCLISKYKVDLICLQESKLEVVDVNLCRRIWGDAVFEWEFIPAISRGGGLICIWRRGLLQNLSCTKGQGYLCIAGNRIGEQEICVF